MSGGCPKCGKPFPCLDHVVRLLTVLALVVLAGCGVHTPHGTVIGRTYVPASASTHIVPLTHQSCTVTTRRVGKTRHTSRSCHTVSAGVHTVTTHTAACWRLHLDTGHSVCVTHHTWLTHPVGDTY
ncbi:hypothetical protein ACIQU5_28065 [Streptomyces sp. NPDC090306]|uniref:hypothetical protein n=1 Tax=Streptomyces sp. NPDC090306 TaxID=3365961 RepID=UPI0038055897